MSSLLPREKSDSRCLVEAAAWRTQLTERDLETHPDFEIWLAADARHRAAWNRVQAPWSLIGEQQTAPELLELRRAALANATEAAHERRAVDVAESKRANLAGNSGQAGREVLSLRRAGRFKLPGIAAIVVLTVMGLLAWYVNDREVYRTGVGERRVLTLADNSQVQLDSSTELRVHYSARARDLTLSRGQARFDVAHDVERPFSVTAGGRKVVATGTAFNVDLLGRNLRVTLIKGRVVVLAQNEHARSLGEKPETTTSAHIPALPFGADNDRKDFDAKGTDEVLLDVGEQLIISDSGSANVVPTNIEHATAWQNGQLVFDNEPLSSVVERVNRYSRLPLVLTDQRAAELRISGVFNTADVDGFVDTLTHYLPVDADSRNGSIRLSHR